MNSDEPTPGPFKYVAVPTEHLPAVYRLLADLSEATAPATGQPEEVHIGGGDDEIWSDDELARFARGDTKTTQLAGLVLDVLAEQPEDQPLTIDELAKRTGLPRSQVKTLWTHVARHLGKHYSTSRPPLTTKWGSQLTPPRENVVYYFMTPGQVEAWKRARNA